MVVVVCILFLSRVVVRGWDGIFVRLCLRKFEVTVIVFGVWEEMLRLVVLFLEWSEKSLVECFTAEKCW